MGIISKPETNTPYPKSPKNSNKVFSFMVGIFVGCGIISIAAIKKKPPIGTRWVKQHNTGIVTVYNSENQPICVFYDTLNLIK